MFSLCWVLKYKISVLFCFIFSILLSLVLYERDILTDSTVTEFKNFLLPRASFKYLDLLSMFRDCHYFYFCYTIANLEYCYSCDRYKRLIRHVRMPHLLRRLKCRSL